MASAQICRLSLGLSTSQTRAGFIGPSSKTSEVKTSFLLLPLPGGVCLVRAGERMSVKGQQLVPSVSLEEEINERVVCRGALGEEAGQQRDRRGHVALPLGVTHAPETDSHVGRPRDEEARTDHDSHLKPKSRLIFKFNTTNKPSLHSSIHIFIDLCFGIIIIDRLKSV